MSGAAYRLLSSGLATAVGQWVLAVASLLAMGLEPMTWWLALSGLLTATITVLTYRLLVRPQPRDDDGDDDDGGPPPDGPGGGGGPPDDGPDPPWWPEFERAFRAHADRAREAA